jgi:hypothetical protein
LFNDLFGFRFDELNTINTSQYYEIEIRIWQTRHRKQLWNETATRLINDEQLDSWNETILAKVNAMK